MRDSRTAIRYATAVAALGFSLQAHASLILNTNVTSTFLPVTATTGTVGNDLPGHPSTLYFGQLQATQTGDIDFFYVGNEAGYINSLLLGGSPVHSTAGLPDNFNAPYSVINSIGVDAGAFADFGFCTSGGDSLGAYGRCASNNDAGSLTAQFSHGNVVGYRSIAYVPLLSFDPISGERAYASLGGASDLWMILWDDSGAQNDDNHDDYVAVASFRPVAVPEPATALLLGAGLLGLAAVRRRNRGLPGSP